MKICKQCGKEFKSGNGHFCSRNCFAESMKIYYKCIVCESSFLRSSKRKNFTPKFCSKSCFHSYNNGVNNPAYKASHLTGTCKTCGTSFMYYKSTSSGQYCSQKCSFNSGEWRQKQSLAKTKTFDGYTDKEIKARIRASISYSDWCYAIYKRDGFKCTKCGDKKNIQAHHIIAFAAIYQEVKFTEFKNISALFDIDNGTTLCEACHKKTDNYYTGAAKIPELRLIKTMNRNYERDQQGFKSFDTYYEHSMELLLNHYKAKLD